MVAAPTARVWKGGCCCFTAVEPLLLLRCVRNGCCGYVVAFEIPRTCGFFFFYGVSAGPPAHHLLISHSENCEVAPPLRTCSFPIYYLDEARHGTHAHTPQKHRP